MAFSLDPRLAAGRNWAGNLRYSAAELACPGSVEELQETVACARKVKALGTRHSFNAVADSSGVLVNLAKLPGNPELDPAARTVTVTAGTRYGELAGFLAGHGFALHNLASLPHISVGGAVATATHGSGTGNLAAAVVAVEMVAADGGLLRADRTNPDFNGMVVSLGALGVFTRLTLAVEPAYEVRQQVYTALPWAAVEEHFEEINSAAYSVSIFGSLAGPEAAQVWLKGRTDDGRPAGGAMEFFGARAADGPRHPVPGMDPVNCSEQLGVPGPWSDRLPHFRLGFTPSNGDELQSEYLVAKADAPAALQALRALSDRIAPLLQVCEIRTVAADEQWLSTAAGRDSAAFHFTWQPRQAEVERLLPLLESALAPLQARPHWGKLFTAGPQRLGELYPQLGRFRELAGRLDPEGKFANPFLARTVLPG